MSWCIDIVINEDSKEKAIKALEETVKKLKKGGSVEYVEYHNGDKNIIHLPRLKYDSYEGLGF